MKKKQIKAIVASIFFILCMLGAVNSFKNISDMRKDFALEQQMQLNIYNTIYEVSTPQYVTFPTWYEAIMEVVNMVFYLFVGGLIYAKNRGFEGKEYNYG